jgi:protein TonB
MTTQKSNITYLDALTRHNWSTWAWATGIALAMNLTLFTIMPYLLNRQPPTPVYDELVSHINVIRMKRPDSKVERTTAKPAEKKEELPPKTPASQPLQAKLILPFEINPRLPAGPATLDLPPLDHMPYIQEAFGLGDLDGPLIPLGRISPVYPMTAKRRGIEGWVKVRFVVNEQGAVETITIVNAKPPGLFDQNVRRCISKWHFKPGTVEGLPVKAWVETTIRFELE